MWWWSEYGGFSGRAGYLDPIPLQPAPYHTSVFLWDIRNNLLHKLISMHWRRTLHQKRMIYCSLGAHELCSPTFDEPTLRCVLFAYLPSDRVLAFNIFTLFFIYSH